MTLISRFWHAFVDLTTWLTISPVGDMGLRPVQHPLGVPVTHPQSTDAVSTGVIPTGYGDSPIFRPPATDLDHDFKCDYSRMEGWFPCSIPENRECWLRNKHGEELNIHTDYEKIIPKGTDRYYTLNITEEEYNADGLPFTEAKLFNGKYPGPWLEACWGDTLHITVINSMTKNGTSIHWHGIRQHESMDMDGVNGITQCPIPPGEQFTYVWRATQYGTSWYHSHYSVQYADGLQGPLTIHGPHSAPFDTSKRPLLVTDWSHNSAFRLLFNSQWGDKTILLNGRGNVTHYGYKNTLPIPDNYELHFNKTPTGKPRRPFRYLLRLINTSFDSTIVFSIDNHWLQVVSADFVPIEPYFTTSVLIGIGQRYNVIVEANPLAGDENPVQKSGNYWIRTWVAKDCGIAPPGRDGKYDDSYSKNGILRYNRDDTAQPNSKPWADINLACSDEPYTSLRPKIPWYVGPAANARHSDDVGEQFNVTFVPGAGKLPQFSNYPLATFSLQPSHEKDLSFTPLQIDYSNPIIRHLDESRERFPDKWVVIPEDYTEKQWVYLVLTMQNIGGITGAHPIHLHGHDFAILQQVDGHFYDPKLLNLTLDNPPRRDVVLLPTRGFVVIAFKADNPGSWLMHCHIARHASEGLALQIMERQSDANKLFRHSTPSINEVERICQAWDNWQKIHDPFEGDSGI